MKMTTKILLVSTILFIVSLSTPAIVYKPDLTSNPKYAECAMAMEDGVQCDAFTFGKGGMISCGLEIDSKTFIDKQTIIQYCDGWDVPMSHVDYGVYIFSLGWLGIFMGIIAWYANVSAGLALLLVHFRKYKVSLLCAFIGLLMGLDSLRLNQVPKDESGSNYYTVDHL
jgi:hypothetical protein